MKVFLCSLLVAALAMTAAAADLTGKWSGTFTTPGPDGPREQSAYLVLKQTGAEVTGSAGPDESRQWTIKTGKVEGNKLTVEVQNPEGPLFKVMLVLTGDRLKGDVVATRPDGQTMNGTMDVGRVK